MVNVLKAMRNLCWICWFLWESFSTLVAHPVSPIILTGSDDSWHREFYWLKYALGFFGVSITAFTLVGCLCCHRNHRAKGFQEFQDERIADTESTLHHSFVGLELEVPRSTNLREQVQFDPLPAEHFILKSSIINKPKPPSTLSLFEEENGEPNQNLSREWSNTSDLHLSREKLKYLREIGQGWFGKVVEGRAHLESLKANDKIGNVVVRILSDEATVKEKAWFLGEATPYFKLRHQNILALIGCCLETDPYLLIFESCPLGDLREFLRSNRDPQSRDVLIQENISIRMALEIGLGLQHMHDNNFTHTDLSARNCLVSSDLSIKLGDYGTGVEKYPLDYYVIGDRALPIRWSAPESLECSETTIETREITPCANIWSYAILLWEIISWGERPYDQLDDEEVIQMLLCKSRSKSSIELFHNVYSSLMLEKRFEESQILEVIKSSLVPAPERLSLEELSQILKDHLKTEDKEDFDERWESSRPNTKNLRSASLKDLRGSLEDWPKENQAKFRLGPQELVETIPKIPFRESDSETEEESWRVKVQTGAYTEKVREKSKSVTDLMILVHIDSDSEDWSLGPQINEKKRQLFGSDGDLRNKSLASEFDERLKKIRDSRSRKSDQTLNFSKAEASILEDSEARKIFISGNPDERDFEKEELQKAESEEQLRVLFELDSILDAEDGSMNVDYSIGINDNDYLQSNSLAKENLNTKGDENDSPVSLESENSYVSFRLDEVFVAAIRNELREKLPHNQMVVELPELEEDEGSTSSEKDSKWDDEVQDLNRASGVDISIRYNIYDSPLSPIFEERESNLNSESLIFEDESKDTSIASKDSGPDEGSRLMETQMCKVTLVENKEGSVEKNHPKGSNDVLADETNDFDSRDYYLYSKIGKTGEGVLLPSPEEESSKWKEDSRSLGLLLPIQLQIQDDLMSTSFVVENDWESQEDCGDVGEEEDENDDDDDDGDLVDQGDDEETSSSSGEFVYKHYSKPNPNSDNVGIPNLVDCCEKEGMSTEPDKQNIDGGDDNNDNDDDADDDDVEDDVNDDDEEEFTPSAWDANLAPHRSALRSPEKTLKSNDQKKSVWFKKQRYHCVYEYPKEAPTASKEDHVSTQWEPTTYADWEEMISEPKTDLYSSDDETTSREEEFCISSSSRPFQFQAGDGTYVSQFFPGAKPDEPSHSRAQDDYEVQQQIYKETEFDRGGQQNRQLGELRHTRDRLKLNLPTSNDVAVNTVCSTLKQNNNDNNDNNLSNENQLFSIKERCNDNLLQTVDSPNSNE